jgi:CDP-6-deoxy-D-xylo-4-hexulose-3-dehydrase
VDCDPRTLNVMAANLERRIEETRLKALFITNALGFAGDLDRIRAVCDSHGVLLFEDNCESLGTELPAGKTGNFGLCSSFSFFVAHHMSTIEGGMVTTSSDDLAEMLRIVRANGWDRNLSPTQQNKWRQRYSVSDEFEARYTFYDLAYNLRPTEITGFIGLQQLPFVEETARTRQENYRFLVEEAAGNTDLLPIDTRHLSVVSNFAFPVVCKDRETRSRYISRFQSAQIEIRPLIAGNMQKQPFYKKYATSYATPGADFIHECAFYCGNYPELERSELKAIAKCLSD